MAKWEDRRIIEHIFILNYQTYKSQRNNKMEMAIVTQGGKYVEYEFSLRQKNLTFFTVEKFKQTFSDYQFTSYSDVCFCDNIDNKHPLYMFLSIVGQQVMFPIKFINADKISGRIGSMFPHYLNKPDKDGRYINRHKGTKKNIYLIWDKVVKAGKCPWITREFDEYLKRNKNGSFRARKRLLRLGAWYQVLKTNQSAKVKKSAQLRMQRLAGAAEFPETVN